jgi:predicted lipid-binding transport protein (Tim44 family)
MGDDVTIEILLFAIVAAVLCHRLWLVLGRRNDAAQPPQGQDPFAVRKTINTDVETGRLAPQPAPAPSFDPDDPVSLDVWLSRLKAVDAKFSERQFLDGAKAAFRVIVAAYASGDRATLKPLLAEDVYRVFDSAIAQRESLHHALETLIDRLSADIEEVRLTGSTARITVGFRSSQINVLRGTDGSIIEGDPKRVEDVLDIWSFARDLRSSDPNWMLVETHHQA